jgi:hypothetical protein
MLKTGPAIQFRFEAGTNDHEFAEAKLVSVPDFQPPHEDAQL